MLLTMPGLPVVPEGLLGGKIMIADLAIKLPCPGLVIRAFRNMSS